MYSVGRLGASCIAPLVQYAEGPGRVNVLSTESTTIETEHRIETERRARRQRLAGGWRALGDRRATGT